MKRLQLAFVACSLIAFCMVVHSVAEENPQLRFPPANSESDSRPSPGKGHPNFIFASFAGLLQQWPNTFAYSGHSVIPGVIPRGTLLYHGTNSHTPPPTEGLEWLVFNPEYSYVVHSHAPGQVDLYTYAVIRPLRIIYLDGQSASLGTPGFLDSQRVLINGTVPKEFGDQGRYIEAEYERAHQLCKIGKEWGFEGVVRMNNCFEVLLCDFNLQGVELLRSTNATDPYDTHDEPGELLDSMKETLIHPTDPTSDSNATFVSNQSDAINPIFPGGLRNNFQPKIEVFRANNSSVNAKNDSKSTKDDDPEESLLQFMIRPRAMNSPFFRRSPQYYFEASSRQFVTPGEVRVSLDPSGFVSFYDRVESLSQKRQSDGTDESPRHTHTLFGISTSDATRVKERLFNILARKNAEGWRTDSERLDWRALVWTIVQTYSNSLVQLDYLLRRDDLTAIDRAAEVRGLTYGMLIPYVDFSSWNVSDPAWMEQSIKRCARGFTFGTYRSSDLTESIEVIIGAIEGTLDRLCSTVLSIFSQSMELSMPIDSLITQNSKLERAAQSRTSEWRRETSELMKWLGWATWGHCDPPCKPNQMCLPPVWPTFWMKGLPKIEGEFPICSNTSR
ncbi:hypothetical protein Pst134EA_013639 [Puccinia striiformis f. sp. tritici]|uniref:hypothetical protein n=1 Tax=Puccinia striiformis f. sp. tritici TaxID=168172 RepID=UPI0020086C4A|nr:hypothetical protein Pst134EA_013639 [Puccinia striiformis f. sp. tritici]KAH9465772.1 hypothetical protein Pst134EA_013639 [Puccinia striiformis f. sp. tritici]